MVFLSALLNLFSGLSGATQDSVFFNKVQVNQSEYFFVMAHDHGWKNMGQHYDLKDTEVFWLIIPGKNKNESNPKAEYTVDLHYLDGSQSLEAFAQSFIVKDRKLCKNLNKERTKDHREITVIDAGHSKKHSLSFLAFIPIQEEPRAFITATYRADSDNLWQKNKALKDLRNFLKSIKIIKKQPKHDALSSDTDKGLAILREIIS